MRVVDGPPGRYGTAKPPESVAAAVKRARPRPSQRRVLRNRLVTGVALLAAPVAAATFPITLATRDSPSSTTDYVVLTAIGLVLATYFLSVARQRIEISERGLRAHTSVRTYWIPWDEIVWCSTGYWGLTIGLRDGRSIRVATLGKPNWSVWFHRRVVADEAVDYINAHRAPDSPRT